MAKTFKQFLKENDEDNVNIPSLNKPHPLFKKEEIPEKWLNTEKGTFLFKHGHNIDPQLANKLLIPDESFIPGKAIQGRLYLSGKYPKLWNNAIKNNMSFDEVASNIEDEEDGNLAQSINFDESIPPYEDPEGYNESEEYENENPKNHEHFGIK